MYRLCGYTVHYSAFSEQDELYASRHTESNYRDANIGNR